MSRTLLLAPCIAFTLLLAALPASGEPAGNEARGGAEQEAPASRRDILGTETKLYSQRNEELVIRDFFQDRKDGVFLDVGSADPIVHSTTYYLEKHLGWSGVAVDALSEYAAAYQSKRPRTQFFAYIVTDHAGTREKFYRVEGAPELSSTQEERDVFGKPVRGIELERPTITLNQLLEEAGIEKVDFLSMDIEGGTEKALLGFDVAKYRPDFVCVERRGSERFLTRYFRKNGYVRHRADDHVNWYFKRKTNRRNAKPDRPPSEDEARGD